jgi:hypothetical protein
MIQRRISQLQIIITFTILVSSITSNLSAQTQIKKRVYGEIGLGFGQTLFLGNVKEKLGENVLTFI